MAQAAEVLEFPAGGIADFYMEDHEIEALEREEAAQEFGSAGIATFEPIATRMASYGRYGDDTVAHVETGELIVPKALIDDNPKLRDSIFSHLRELGVEDPERYVVGSGVNSINPDTGMPEFFLKKLFKGVKKGVSKLAKGVSKALKGVTKVVKKAAPFVLPFVLGPAGLGFNMMYAGALGAGIGTLIQGGSLKEAVTAGLIGGAIGGVSQGVSSGLSAGKGNFLEGFTKGVKNVATNPMQSSFTQAMTVSAPDSATLAQSDVVQDTVASATETGATSPVDTVVSATSTPTSNTELFAGSNKAAYEAIAKNPNLSSTEKMIQLNRLAREDQARALFSATEGSQTLAGSVTAGPDQMFLGAADALPPTPPPTILEQLQSAGKTAMDYGGKAMDFLTGTPAEGALNQIEIDAYNKAIAAGVPESLATKQAARAVAEATPGIIRTFGPTAALAGAGLYAAGGFDTKDDDDGTDEEMAAMMGPNQYYQQYKDRFLLGGFTPKYAQGPVKVATTYTKGLGQYEDGGGVFPRRVGGIMPDEGTPGKDSVKAMLMPGEFVMTTNAVKGLGDGDNNKGINRMYDMMRGLEAKGKAMA